MDVLERCAKTLAASYWGIAPDRIDAEWDDADPYDKKRHREAAAACLQASGGVEAVRAMGSAWRAKDDEAIFDALVQLEDAFGLTEQGR